VFLQIAALLATTANLAASTAIDPYSIYERAETFWLGQVYPAYLSYDVAVRVTQGDVTRVEHYASSFDATDGSIWVDAVSDYEREHPPVPHGINVSILGFNVTKPQPPIDFIGVPVLTPTYTFGMAPFVAAAPPGSAQAARALVAEIRREFHDPYPPGRKPLPGTPKAGLPTIGRASVTAGAYDISLVGIEPVNGHDCYHLTLRPRRDPGRYRLRDLWVDVRNAATWRLREALNFVDGPGTTVPWTVDFDNLDGIQYIESESTDAPVRYDGETYSQAVVSFENVHAVAMPDSHPLYIPPQSATLKEPN
jgi:hypothetical protein